HADPGKVALAESFLKRSPPDPETGVGAAHVLRTGQPQLIEDMTDALLVRMFPDPQQLRISRDMNPRSYIGVPLCAQRRTLGVLTFVSSESGRRYDARDLQLACDLAQRAAQAIESASLYRQVRESDRRKDEFLATLSHELRNPLAPISHALEIMRLAPGDEE